MSALWVNSGTAIASGEEVRVALRELHKRAALMQRQAATLDRQIRASLVFGRRAFLAKQEWPVDQLDVDSAVLHNLDAVAISIIFAGWFFGIGAGSVRGEFHRSLSRSLLARALAASNARLLSICSELSLRPGMSSQ
jgi:hypothetical protein